MKINLDELRSREQQGLIRTQTNGDLTIWTYTDKCQWDRYWDYYTRSARGLVTDKEGNIVTKPFPKFFNLYENEETMPQNLPDSMYEITPKLDGSLLNITMYQDEILLTTKGSFDNIYIDWAKKHLNLELLEMFLRNTIYPITICTEIVLPPALDTMRRVVDHDPGVYFLAQFNNSNGQELHDLSWDQIMALGACNIKVLPKETRGLDYIMEQGAKEAGTEGWVIKYYSGLRVKIKTWWYLGIFKFLNHVNDEGIKEYMINNPDDTGWMQAVPEELRGEVEQLVKNINMRYDIEYKRLIEIFREASRVSETRKDFALLVKDDPRASFLFMLKDGKDIREKLLRVV